jgi:outer membrane protein assembly factor BamB
MYVGVAPSVESPSIPFKSGIYVYDIDNAHSLVKIIPLPAGTAAPANSTNIAPVYSIRGMVADTKSNTLYITHYGGVSAQIQGYLLAVDLTTGATKWQMSFSPTNPNPLQNSAVDRGCFSPDGKTLYIPSGEAVTTKGFWYEVDTASHTVRKQLPFAADGKVPGAHNTICSSDGRVFMSAIAAVGSTGNTDNQHSLKIYTPKRQ